MSTPRRCSCADRSRSLVRATRLPALEAPAMLPARVVSARGLGEGEAERHPVVDPAAVIQQPLGRPARRSSASIACAVAVHCGPLQNTTVGRPRSSSAIRSAISPCGMLTAPGIVPRSTYSGSRQSTIRPAESSRSSSTSAPDWQPQSRQRELRLRPVERALGMARRASRGSSRDHPTTIPSTQLCACGRMERCQTSRHSSTRSRIRSST